MFKAVFHRIPFIGRNDQGTAFLNHLSCDGQILLFQHVIGIQHQDHDLCEINRAAGVRSGKALYLFRDTGTLAQTRRIDHAQMLVLPDPIHSYRIPGNPSLRAGQQAVFAQIAVDQGRFPHIRATHNRDLKRALRRAGFRPLFLNSVFRIGVQIDIQIGHMKARQGFGAVLHIGFQGIIQF